jgi:hypothetical protein
MERRSLETYAVALWAEKRLKSPFSFTRDALLLRGDAAQASAISEMSGRREVLNKTANDG